MLVRFQQQSPQISLSKKFLKKMTQICSRRLVISLYNLFSIIVFICQTRRCWNEEENELGGVNIYKVNSQWWTKFIWMQYGPRNWSVPVLPRSTPPGSPLEFTGGVCRIARADLCLPVQRRASSAALIYTPARIYMFVCEECLGVAAVSYLQGRGLRTD